jgi:protein Tex
MDITKALAAEFSLNEAQAAAVVELIDAGNTIPFIARYRKEATGSLDDQILREVGERLAYLRGLDKRRDEIQKALSEQGALTQELAGKLTNAETLAELEDLYRPFRPKRRTRATIAKERGLDGLADILMGQAFTGTPEENARAFVDAAKGVQDTEAALAGARDIIAEVMSDDAAARRKLRELGYRGGVLETKRVKDEDSVYRLYYEYAEPVSRIPDHRILAINRGERDEFLHVTLRTDDIAAVHVLAGQFIKAGRPGADQLLDAAKDSWERLIFPSIARELRSDLTDRAGTSAARLFGQNLHQLLMQPPVKGAVTMGVDPGFRTGSKLAVVDAGGRVLATGVGYFTIPGQTALYEQAKKSVSAMIMAHNVTAIAIGNGTASRESEAFIADILGSLPEGIRYTIVNEAGASVYSASKLGAGEFPELDISLRSAISIARRLQDPLAELVKIDPKSIGVGQYQHDVKETQLSETADGVVEACVNAVGVEISTASAQLLSYVAGVGPALARNITAYRDESGIASRSDLKKVQKLGPRAFEQCAGFIRVRNGKNPLDATGVHPESYAAAQQLIARLGYSLADVRGGAPDGMISKATQVGTVRLAEELGIGEPTLKDILQELRKPGRDPRDELPPVLFRRDVCNIEDLVPGMQLKGTIRNVIDFGAFADIGVHHDGLIHISRMSGRFIRHPSEVVKVGDAVDVYVMEVDVKKKRIALSMLKP